MVTIVNAQYFVVELGPARVVFAGWFMVERMAGGADADERFTLGQMRANEVELCLGWRSAADTQEK